MSHIWAANTLYSHPHTHTQYEAARLFLHRLYCFFVRAVNIYLFTRPCETYLNPNADLLLHWWTQTPETVSASETLFTPTNYQPRDDIIQTSGKVPSPFMQQLSGCSVFLKLITATFQRESKYVIYYTFTFHNEWADNWTALLIWSTWRLINTQWEHTNSTKQPCSANWGGNGN